MITVITGFGGGYRTDIIPNTEVTYLFLDGSTNIETPAHWTDSPLSSCRETKRAKALKHEPINDNDLAYAYIIKACDEISFKDHVVV